MTVTLGVLERLVLLSILPREGTITTIRIVRELREALSFSEEEHAALNFERVPDGGTRWDDGQESPKEMTLGPRAHALIVECLQNMDKEGKLGEDYLSVWDKFMEAADEPAAPTVLHAPSEKAAAP